MNKDNDKFYDGAYPRVNQLLQENENLLFPNKKYSKVDLENALLSSYWWPLFPPKEDKNLAEEVIHTIPFRNPSVSVLSAFFLVDRFYLGDIGKGVLKLITSGGLGIWWIADMFSAKNRCREYNCQILLSTIKNDIGKTESIADKTKKLTPTVKQLAKSAKEWSDTFGKLD